MNKHFDRSLRARVYPPRSAIGHLDHIEIVDPESSMALVTFDLVDEAWLEGQCWWGEKKRRADGGIALPSVGSPSALDYAPLFRLEIEMDLRHDWNRWFEGLGVTMDPNGFITNQWQLEASWFRFSFDKAARGALEATLYGGLFAPPTPVLTKGSISTAAQGKALAGIFSLNNLPLIWMPYLKQLLKQVSGEWLAVYDVGQGNANALLNRQLFPTLYYDLGAGVYRNQHTTPPNLTFCLLDEPPIILSHWDVDHWAGAYATKVNNTYPALQRTWIAPLQNIGPVHLAFAHDVIDAGGQFFIYPANSVSTFALQHGRQLKVGQGSGKGRNDTGIVLAVENVSRRSKASWILTGDCGYQHFPAPQLTTLAPVGIVAPHHGGPLPSSGLAPAPGGIAGQRRLVYSFGPGNKHGKNGISHPVASGVKAHAAWNQGNWNLTGPFAVCPGGETRITAEHPPNVLRDSVLVGWSPPNVAAVPCPCVGHSSTTWCRT